MARFRRHAQNLARLRLSLDSPDACVTVERSGKGRIDFPLCGLSI